MRNLKKVLSLSLAFVMLLGMMIVGGSAVTADYNDAADVSYTEAVDVMSVIGVFNGDENGDFNPTKALAREEAAKIITYMMMGKDAADKLGATTAPYSDVAADRWSAGSIAYCTSLGIIAGNGDGTFAPRNTVTGYAFAKMLLCALGYDATIEGYVNNDLWAVNVNKDALVAGLLNGLDISLSSELTREEACQMAFNALTAAMVEYSGGVNITTPDGVVVNSGAERDYVAGSVAVGANWDNTVGDGIMQFCEEHYTGLKCTITPAAADTIANQVWVYGTSVVTVYEAPAFTFTADLTSAANKTVENTLKGYTVISSTGSIDGLPGSAGAVDTVAEIKALTGNGVKVDVYAANGVVHAVTVTNTGLVEITGINPATGALTLTVRADAWSSALTATIAKDETDPVYNALAAIGLNGFALVTAEYDGTNYDVVTVAEPEVATGLVTYIDGNSTTNTALTVGGKAYTIAAINDGAITAAGTFTVSALVERNLYLDAYGYAMYNKNTVTPIVTMPKTIYVTKAYTAADKWGTTVNMAQGVLNDGSVVYVQVASPATADALYTYTVSPATGVYTLSSATVGDKVTVGIDNVTIAIAGITPTTKAADGWYFASDVQFMYINGSGDLLDVEVKDGMQIGQALTTSDWYVIAKDVNNNYVIKTVIIEGSAPTAPAEDLIFVKTAWTATNYTNTKLNSLGATLYGYDAYVNGAKTTIWVTAAGAVAQGVYTYTEDAVNEATTMGSAATGYVGTAEALSGITVIGDAYYWDVATAAYDSFDISGATVYDTTGNGLTSATALKAALTAGKSITVVYSYNAPTQSIPVIYVVTCA